MNLYEFFKRMMPNPLYEHNKPVPLTISDGTNTIEVVMYARDLDNYGAEVVFEGVIFPKDVFMDRKNKERK